MRRSKRLAAKQTGRARKPVFRAQDLLCRKHKLVRIAVTAARSSSSLARPALKVSGTTPIPPVLIPDSSQALYSVPVLSNREGAEIDSSRREIGIPLSPGEINSIHAACGILVGADLGKQPGPSGQASGGTKGLIVDLPAGPWGLFFTMVRNRTFKFLTWNVRGLNSGVKCLAVKTVIRLSRCGVVCL